MADKIKEELPEFFIEGKPTEEVLGKGSYGVVKKIIVDETECAAKIIYSSISFSSDVGSRYIKELSLQSNLRHPNITQFLGICQLPDSSLPALVTELMHSNLHEFLINPGLKEAIPLSYKKSILEDVTKGLIYLHKKEVVHRDLTAKNVLLTTSLVAKIADLGNSRILPQAEFAELTSLPGTQVYMPPEANSTYYTHKLDIFSFGHLALFTMIQEFPDKLDHHTYPDPDSPIESVKGRTEVERRAKYFEKMEGKLPQDVHDAFADLIKQCLTFEGKRPEADEILYRLRQVQLQRNYEGLNSIEAALIEKHEIEEAKRKTMCEHEQTIQEMQEYISNLQKDVDIKNNELKQKDKDILTLQGRLRALEAHDLGPLGQRQNEIRNLAPVQIAKPANLGDIGEGINPANLAPANEHEAPPEPEVPPIPLQVPPNIHEVPPQPKVVPKQQTAPPINMSNYPQAVFFNNHIYMGGGFTKTENVATVLEFDPQREIWTNLAKCPTKYFGMAVVKEKLWIIGGTELSSSMKHGRIYSMDFESKTWNPFECTSMLTHRSTPSVVSYADKWLIAIGGEDKNGQVLSSVERFDVDRYPAYMRHWEYCSDLPVKCAHFSTAIVDDKLYTFGTTTYGAAMSIGLPSNSVFFAPINELLLSTKAGDSVWQEIRYLPLKASTAVSFNHSLFALGGTEKSYGGSSTSIFKLEYQQNPDGQPPRAVWKKVGDLPIALCQCACTQNGNSIFVHGRRVKVADVCVYALTIE